MLPVILIVAAAALITACESSSSPKKKAKKINPPPSFRPMKEKYTGLNLDSSSYGEESDSKKLMKKMRPGNKRPANKDGGKKGGSKPKSIGRGTGSPAARKCTRDGHSYSGVIDSSGGQSGVCKNAKGKSCEEWAYFRGECSLD